MLPWPLCPGTGGTDNDVSEWLTSWEGKAPDLGIKGPPYRQLGVDAKWENCVVVVDGSGKIIETWKQWDKLFRRPHSIYISPYDPEKNVWIVDDNMQVIYKFTHDGSKLCRPSARRKWRARTRRTSTGPTYLDWLPDGTFFVSDGYTGTRVAKFNKDGKFLMQWGTLGGPPRGPVDTRPGLLQQRPWRGGRSGHSPRLCERSKQPSHSGVRRKRQVFIRMED